jgi:hypothetical protein
MSRTGSNKHSTAFGSYIYLHSTNCNLLLITLSDKLYTHIHIGLFSMFRPDNSLEADGAMFAQRLSTNVRTFNLICGFFGNLFAQFFNFFKSLQNEISLSPPKGKNNLTTSRPKKVFRKSDNLGLISSYNYNTCQPAQVKSLSADDYVISEILITIY